ncbi:MAG TPA: dihydrodipicolinate synthase family protein [Verrucomicrobiae bacterium]|nr:dihydrodipicolinate synthase family protein [Verrucomicrobiae bacterium]
MSGAQSAAASRSQRLARLFPEGVPTLWCPSITHYDRDGGIDAPRMAAHLKHLSPSVKGFLIPGSTGDGWEMDAREIRRLLEVALEQAVKVKLHLLIGVLKTDAEEAKQTILDTVAWLGVRTGLDDPEASLAKARVCGFTVCPPRGADLSQAKIGEGLTAILETGLPIALYQLPQVTQNEMSPDLVTDLASTFDNFVLFKDTSGADRVALSGRNVEGVFLVRGAEGDYVRWLRHAGGPYDGFLLSTANSFGHEFHRMIQDLSAGRVENAKQVSERVTATVNEVFGAVTGLPHGNPFANANKAMDHFFAHGSKAADVLPPRLHAGPLLPEEVIRAAGEALTRHRLMPARGYLE